MIFLLICLSPHTWILGQERKKVPRFYQWLLLIARHMSSPVLCQLATELANPLPSCTLFSLVVNKLHPDIRALILPVGGKKRQRNYGVIKWLKNPYDLFINPFHPFVCFLPLYPSPPPPLGVISLSQALCSSDDYSNSLLHLDLSKNPGVLSGEEATVRDLYTYTAYIRCFHYFVSLCAFSYCLYANF